MLWLQRAGFSMGCSCDKKITGPDNPHKSSSSNDQKKWLKRHGERRKDEGDGGGSIISKVACEELCVRKLCVKELCVCERL